MLGTVIENLSLTDALLLIGLVGITVKTLMEGKGWTRSSKLLREENADLIARNHTLEEDRNDRIAIEITLNARIDALEAKVRDLESRDQAAVLQALRDHELGAIGRAEERVGEGALGAADGSGLLAVLQDQRAIAQAEWGPLLDAADCVCGLHAWILLVGC